MNLEQQVCSLYLAKRLKELGLKQESWFVWASDVEVTDSFIVLERRRCWLPNECAAFTVAELGEMLPEFFKREPEGYLDLAIRKDRRLANAWWNVSYKNIDGHPVQYSDMSEANARAKMLIYLLENRFVTV
jgi:hypothetical protein